jgi:hypothetical protein
LSIEKKGSDRMKKNIFLIVINKLINYLGKFLFYSFFSIFTFLLISLIIIITLFIGKRIIEKPDFVFSLDGKHKDRVEIFAREGDATSADYLQIIINKSDTKIDTLIKYPIYLKNIKLSENSDTLFINDDLKIKL